MRGLKERRYLTEKYQRKQVRLSYIFTYDKPHDTERYIRTNFARKQRFVDLLRGNFATFVYRWEYERMLGYNTPHKFTREELGRFRNHSWKDCGRAKCSGCSNPRRGYIWNSPKEQITMQERISEMSMKDDLEYYYQYEGEIMYYLNAKSIYSYFAAKLEAEREAAKKQKEIEKSK